jgi:hypothetical protein
LFESFLLIYRLAVLGDFDITELEHKTTPETRVYIQEGMKQGIISTQTTFLSPYGDQWYSVRLMLVVVSFMIGVLIMNLFIAVLCSSYDSAASIAQECFMQSRANIVLDQVAVRKGYRYFKRCWCKRRPKSQQVMSATYDVTSTFTSAKQFFDIRPLQSSESTNAMAMTRSNPGALRSFLWYVKQAPADS